MTRLNFSRRASLSLLAVILCSILVRKWIAAASPHSGYRSPPMFGDFEAQRHWVELTSHLPLSQWYVNGPQNNLTYWGLDYPPLTAFHSRVVGLVAWLVMPADTFKESFALGLSHGSEKAETIAFMRDSVLWSELFVFLSGAVAVSLLFATDLSTDAATTTPSTFIWALVYAWNGSLAMIFIDHGHFQYNAVSLGLMVWAVYYAGKHVLESERYAAVVVTAAHSTIRKKPTGLRSLWMSIMFAAMSMSFKQMSLYYSIGLGGWYLAQCIRYARMRQRNERLRTRPGEKQNTSAPPPPASPAAVFVGALFYSVGTCAIAGFGTFSIVFSPFYWTGTLPNVLERIFPVGRGLYEDKVANAWCVLSPVFKLPEVMKIVASLLPQSSPVEHSAAAQVDSGNFGAHTQHQRLVVLCCLTSTVICAAPAAMHVVRRAWREPRATSVDSRMSGGDDSSSAAASRAREGLAHASLCAREQLEQLLWCMLSSSLAFFLFAFQVHEKSILLPMLPATLLAALVSSCSLTTLRSHGGRAAVVALEKETLVWTLAFFALLSLSQLAEKDNLRPLFMVLLAIAWGISYRTFRRLAHRSGPSQEGKPSNAPRASWLDAERVYRILMWTLAVEEVVRIGWLEHHPRYPHLGLLAQFSVCAACFIWVLVRSWSEAAPR